MFLKTFSGVYLIYNVVLVFAAQQSDSAIHEHISTLVEILFPNRSLQSTEKCPLRCMVGLY